MEYIITAFKSRAQTMKFGEILFRIGIPYEIVSTPKEAGVGCGLSVKTLPNYFKIVKDAVFKTGFSSFAGFFQVKYFGSKKSVRSI